MKTFSVLLVALSGLVGPNAAGAQTIPEMARMRPPNPIVRILAVDVATPPIDELVRGAAVVLEATLTKGQSYLTADQNYILTDYRISPIRVLSGRLASDDMQKPGQTAPPVLTMSSGSYTVDGFTVFQVDHVREEIRSGGRYLLFLTPGKKPGQ